MTTGGLHFLVVSATNMIFHGLPTNSSHLLYSVSFPLQKFLFGRVNDDLLQSLQADSRGVVEVAPLPFFQEALPFFVISVALEILLGLLRGKGHYYNYQDTVSSLSAGLINQTTGVLFRSVAIFPYMYIHKHYRLADLSFDNTLTWFVAFIGIDFGYYWFHRAAHVVNCAFVPSWRGRSAAFSPTRVSSSGFWAMHEIHHSSEEYNLSTALRQTIFAGVDGFMFYLPLAPFLPVEVRGHHHEYHDEHHQQKLRLPSAVSCDGSHLPPVLSSVE